MPVELALSPDSKWDIGGADLVEAAHGAGFSAVGLAAEMAGDGARTAMQHTGIRCHELVALIVGEDEQANEASASRLASAASEVGAPWVLAVFGAGLESGIVDSLRRCAGLFGQAGARMAVEFSPLGPVSSLRDGLAVVRAVGEDMAGLVIDSWHFCRSESTWDELALVPLDLIAYLQFTDALEPISSSGMRETMNRRAMPGDGVLDLRRFSTTLLDRGWAGTVSVEVLSAELRELPVADFAARAYRATARYWS